jgi:hypothetical protein
MRLMGKRLPDVDIVIDGQSRYVFQWDGMSALGAHALRFRGRCEQHPLKNISALPINHFAIFVDFV